MKKTSLDFVTPGVIVLLRRHHCLDRRDLDKETMVPKKLMEIRKVEACKNCFGHRQFVLGGGNPSWTERKKNCS